MTFAATLVACDRPPAADEASTAAPPGDCGALVTFRPSDGDFRGLLVARDGGVVSNAGTIDVRLAGERYRLPAAVRR